MGNQRGQVVNHNYTRKSYNETGYSSFSEFYPFYLGEHCEKTNRRLHLIGTTNSVILAILFLISGNPLYLVLGLFQGYGLAWVGHFRFEKNKPATFKHPVYSLMGDFRMWWEVITGSRTF